MSRERPTDRSGSPRARARAEAQMIDTMAELGFAPTCCAHCRQLMIGHMLHKHCCDTRGITITDVYELYLAREH